MTLRPILPVLPDETITSYLRRVAAFHAGMDVFPFLNALNLSRAAVIDPAPDTFDRITEITGQSRDELHRMVIRSVQPRIRALGNEQFHTEFVNLKQTSFCPACLLEDAAPGSPSGGLRVGRISWRLQPVRTCPHHDIALVRTPIAAKSHRFQHMDEVAPNASGLLRLFETAEHRVPSSLQRYVEYRLAGEAGPAWLDAQPVDLAVRACEMLGLLMTCDVTRKMPCVSASDLDAAGAAGFNHAVEGEDGICAALRSVHERAKAAGFGGGPPQVFGFFYAWLQDGEKQKPFGPIKDVARAYVTDNFAVEAGTMLFGEMVTQVKKHNVYTLARKLGSHAATVHRSLFYADMLQGDPKQPSRDTVFDAAAAEALFTRLQTALSSRELRKFLNCGRAQAEQLVGADILPQIIGRGDRGRNASLHVSRDDAEVFLQDLLREACHVDKATDGMCDIPMAARASGWSVVDIVRALLASQLRTVECINPELRFMSVLVDPKEIRAVLTRGSSGDLVGFAEAARLLGIKRYGVRKFLALRDAHGHPYLHVHSVQNAEGGKINLVPRSEIERFLASHVALTEIAAQVGSSKRYAKARLAAAEIGPVNDADGIGRTFYRRRDAEIILLP